jgi:hypothetical protein
VSWSVLNERFPTYNRLLICLSQLRPGKRAFFARRSQVSRNSKGHSLEERRSKGLLLCTCSSPATFRGPKWRRAVKPKCQKRSRTHSPSH